jgi:hypothetical protein
MANPLLSGRAVLVAAALSLGLAPPSPSSLTVAAAQSAPGAGDSLEVLRGRVVKDGAPVAGVAITLHRVTPTVSGELETRSTGADGGFEFRLPRADTASFSVFFATAEYQAVRYFGRPLHPDEVAGDYLVEVHDTATVLTEPVRIARRDVVLIPEQAGGWEVNEIVRIRNPSSQTLVSRSGMPAWEFRIPAAAVDFEAGEGEVLADEVRRMGDRVFLLTPLIPGERELFLRYRIPGSERRIALPSDSGVDTINVFVRQPSPVVTVEGLQTTEVLTAGQERFLRYGGADFEPGSAVSLAWKASATPPISPNAAAVGVTVLVLLFGLAFARRSRQTGRRGPPRPAPAGDPHEGPRAAAMAGSAGGSDERS